MKLEACLVLLAVFPPGSASPDTDECLESQVAAEEASLERLAPSLSLVQLAGNRSKDTCASLNTCYIYKPGLPCQCNSHCVRYGNCCADFHSTCHEYHFRDPSLSRPSEAPLITFYVYRAQNDRNFGPLNTNAASLSGVLWYLQNEIVPYCSTQTRGGTPGYRRYGKTRILRYKVTMKATTPLFKRGMNFGSRVAFDSGKNTGAWEPEKDMVYSYQVYGFNLGCNELGAGPYPACPSRRGDIEGFCPIKYGDRALWYSLPGPCPSHDYRSKSDSCAKTEPGGYCKGTPTGAGDCTWTYEHAGEVNLDHLSGISRRFRSHQDFCRRGCVEYEKFRRGQKDRGRCGITFWDHRMNEGKNKWRSWRLDQLFKKKYPHLPSDHELPTPRCDFDRGRFYDGLR